MTYRINDMGISREHNQKKYLTHLTKDCYGKPAILNLISILDSGVIYAKKCNGFHRRSIWNSGLKSADYSSFRQFDTVSFTSRLETISPFLKYKRRNSDKLSSVFSEFGVVFSRQKILRNRGREVRTITDAMKGEPKFKVEKEINKISSYKNKGCALKASKRLASTYFNVDLDGRNYSHAYEQEYRVLGDFRFFLWQVKAILVKNKKEFLTTLKVKNEILYDQIVFLERKKMLIITSPKFIGRALKCQ